MTFKEMCSVPLAPVSWETLRPVVKEYGSRMTNQERDGHRIIYMTVVDMFDTMEDDGNRHPDESYYTNDDGEYVDEDGDVVAEENISYHYRVNLHVTTIDPGETETRNFVVLVDAGKLLAIAQPLYKKNKLDGLMVRRAP